MRSSTTLLITLRSLRDADISSALSNLSAYYVAFDRWTDARIHAREALCVARETREYGAVASMLQHLAAIAALSPAPPDGAPTRRELAAKLLGYVDRYRTRIGASRNAMEQTEYARAVGVLRERLGAQLTALMLHGSSMTLNEAFEHALSV